MNRNSEDQAYLPTWLSRVALGLVLLCFCLPFVTLNDLVFPHITGRNFIFRMVVSVGAGVIFLAVIHAKSILLDRISICVIGLLLVKIISMFTSADIYHSFYSSLIRMEGVLSWIYLVGFYFLLKIAFTQKMNINYVLAFSTCLASISVLYILFKFFGSSSINLDRQSFTFGNPAYYASYLLFHVGFSLFLFFSSNSKLYKSIWILLFVLCVIGLVLTGTRASILGVCFSFVIWSIYILKGKLVSLSKRQLLALLSVGLLLGILCISFYGNVLKSIPMLERIEETNLNQKEIRTRLASWDAGWQAWKAKPFLGYGDGNFEKIYHLYNQNSNVDNWVDNSHNHLVEYITSNGIVGLAIYLLLILWVLKVFFINKLETHYYVLGGVTMAWFIQNLFIFDTINSLICLMLLIAIAASNKVNKTTSRISKNMFTYPSAILISLGILVITWHLHIDAFRSAQTIKKANLSLSIDSFRAALETDNFSNKEATIFLLANLESMLNSDESESKKVELIEFALLSAENQLEKTPNDIRLLLLGSKLYYSVKSYKLEYEDAARVLIKRAKKYAPYRKDVDNLYQYIFNTAG